MSQYYKPGILKLSYAVHALLLIVLIIGIIPAFGFGGASVIELVAVGLIILVIAGVPLIAIYFQQKGYIRLGYIFGIYLAIEICGLFRPVPAMIKALDSGNQYSSGGPVEFYPFFLVVFFFIFALHLYLFGKTLLRDIRKA